jgi:hypothetical protein
MDNRVTALVADIALGLVNGCTKATVVRNRQHRIAAPLRRMFRDLRRLQAIPEERVGKQLLSARWAAFEEGLKAHCIAYSPCGKKFLLYSSRKKNLPAAPTRHSW